MEAQQVVQEELKAIQEEAEKEFRARVRAQMNLVMATQKQIAALQAQLKKQQDDLKALKLEVPDHSALFQ